MDLGATSWRSISQLAGHRLRLRPPRLPRSPHRLAPGASGAPGPSPALLPATYVDPVSGVVVLQTRGPDDTVNTLPTIRQLDAYQSGAATPPTAHTDIRNSPA